jgi:ferric-dicitrate binding protein FerR (iron transport regulator)
MENQLIIKYLKQELTEEESASVAAWIRNNKAHQDFLFSLEELYWANQMEELKQLADTNREWKKLEYRILHVRETFHLISILKYVAIGLLLIALPFMVYQTGIFNKTNSPDAPDFLTIVTGKGERSKLILPDGTNVWLNACSSLIYSTGLSSERQLKLSGEAYFEVTKDEHRPFVVSTPLLNISVLGTKFNLKAFEEENEVRTTLYEGSVAANTSDKSFERMLKPGEQLIYRKDKTVLIASVDGNKDKDWKEGILHFRKQKLQDIVRSLERNFNVEITITDSKLSQEEFTCEFKDAENLTEILNILKMTKKLDYSIKSSKVTITKQ